MIIMYTQDKTYIYDDVDLAKKDLLSVYGIKLGTEAYEKIKHAREGTRYRKNGGPLVCVVNKEKASEIAARESLIGMF